MTVASSKRARGSVTLPSILVVDIGGTNVKVYLPDRKLETKIPSGPHLTSRMFARKIREAVKDWSYERVSVGFPAPVMNGRPITEPPNLGGGWIGLDLGRIFRAPVKVLNDAAMQALGC